MAQPKDQDQPQIERKKVAEFQPDRKNANKGTERGLAALENSIERTGLGRSIVVDKHGHIIAGNKTTERAVDKGIEEAIVVHTTGDQLVVVQRDDLDLYDPDPNNKARQLAYNDNRVAQLDLEWDGGQLLADQLAGFEFDDVFFKSAELSRLFPSKSDSGNGGNNGNLGTELVYRVIVECGSEQDQADLLERLTGEGLKCQALIS